MQVIIWGFWQLLSYSIVSWLAFALIAFCAARYGGWCFVPVGHLVVAIVVVLLDIRWIRAEMNTPGWNGIPDMDVIFYFGMLMRILLINTILLLVTGTGICCRRCKRASNHDIQVA
jgi:hypothetical protein